MKTQSHKELPIESIQIFLCLLADLRAFEP